MPVVAVGAVAAVVAALMALLLLYGSAALARMVANLIPNWHLPGLGNIRSFVLGAANAALHTVAGWLDAAVGNAANWVLAPWHILNALIAKVASVGHSIYHAILAARLLAHTIYTALLHFVGARIATVEHLAYYLYAAAIALTHSVYATLLHFVGQRIASVVHYAEFLYAAAKAYAAGVYSTLLHFVGERVSALEHYAQVLTREAIAYADLRFTQAIHYAEAIAKTTATAAIGVLTTDIAHAIHIPWIDIRDEVAVLEGVIATDLPDVGALVRAIPKAVPLDIAATMTGVLAIDRMMLKYLQECGIPNCKNLGGLGKDLLKLLELVGGAGLLAYLAAMVHDPVGTADETDRVLSGLVEGTVTTFRDLIGV